MKHDREQARGQRARGPSDGGAARTKSPASTRASDDPKPRDLRLAGLAGIFVAATIVPYVCCARQCVDRDPFVYGQVAKEVVAGKTLYLDAWMDKPPLGILAYAVPQWFAPGSYTGVTLFGALVIAAQAALFACAFRTSGVAAASCLLFVTLFPMTEWGYVWPSTEHFSNLFVTGNVLVSLGIYRQGRFTLAQCLAVGAMTCAAFHVRQNALLSGLVPAVAVLVAPRPLTEKLTGWAAMVAGATLAWGVLLALVAWLGDLSAYFYVTFAYPSAYASAGRWQDLLLLFDWWFHGLMPFFMALFAGLAMTRANRWLVLSAVAVGIAGCVLPLRSFPHYWVNGFPYLALLVGLGTERLGTSAPRVAWMLTAAIAAVLLPSMALRVVYSFQEPRYLSFARVAEVADQLAPPDGTLLVCGRDGCEAIQFASRLAAANTYSMLFQLQAPLGGYLPKPLATIYDEYVARPPDVMAVQEDYMSMAATGVDRPDAPEFLALVRRLLASHNYRTAGMVNGYVIAVRAVPGTAGDSAPGSATRVVPPGRRPD